MRRKATPIQTTELCGYGCGGQAYFVNKAGKYICKESHNKCEEVRRKNSSGVAQAHKDGRAMGWNTLIAEGKAVREWSKGKTSYTDSRIVSKYTPENLFTYNGKGPHKKILIEERGHQCEKCKNTEWLDDLITLELEHKDGDSKNNVKDNLELLCPNCHSQTKTWRRAKKSYGKNNRRHTDEEIIEAIICSENIHQALSMLDLKWGSASTIVTIMGKHNVNFTPR